MPSCHIPDANLQATYSPMGVFNRKSIGLGITAFLLSVALVEPKAEAQQRPEYVSNVVVVQFAPGVVIANKARASGLQDFDRRATRYGVHLIERVYPFLDHVEPTPKMRRNLLALRRTHYVRYNANTLPVQVAEDLAAAASVVYAEPLLVYRTQALGTWERVDPDDPNFGDQTELRHLRLPEAWDVVKSEDRTPRVVIAIVDAGGEWRHRDLRANVWTNPDEIAGDVIDNDGNGFIDDVHGVNFANGNDTNNDPTGLLETPRSARHGTASAGAASAVADNGVGIAGAAWNADIMHINVACPIGDGGICYGYEGILYAAANGADIINASWSGPVSIHAAAQFYDQSLNLATDMGALVVAAASNENVSNDLFRFYPARHPRVLSVGATEKNTRTRAVFSNYGKLVNVFAPGVDILTTGSRNSYMLVNGTSFSSPLVAGVAALVKTRFPDMTADAVREQVRLTSENMDAENPGLAGQLGRGFVNAMAAIQEPSLPAVRLKRWSWADDDGDRLIASGDVVTVTATVVNYLADARQLRVGLVATEAYPFIDMTTVEVEVGSLASGDSAEVRFEFAVAMDAPPNRRVRFFTRIRDGAFEDESDMLSFGVNPLEAVHRNLSALYTATGGDNWTRNDNWDITTVPSEEELATWYGVGLSAGWLVELFLPENNLTGTLPAELGNLAQLQELNLWDNTLTGLIPSELGNLVQLTRLNLSGNTLTGLIPSELGNLAQLQELNLSGNSLTGAIPPNLGSLSQLKQLDLSYNALTGMLPRSLMHLGRLEVFNFGGQYLCAPADDGFQAWLSNIPNVYGSTCAALQFTGGIAAQTFTTGAAIPALVLPEASGGIPPYIYELAPALPAGLVFDDATRTINGVPAEVAAVVSYTYLAADNGGSSVSLTFTIEVAGAVSFEDIVADQYYPSTHPIIPLVLPEATGGVPPVRYALTPTLPTGLSFDPATRTISGTPAAVTAAPVPYTYKATDTNESADSLQFNIEVYSPVTADHEALPRSFAVRGNYPNPFHQSTRIVFDLPWPAWVTVEVVDVTGRRVHVVPRGNLAAGWEHSIELSGATLPSGLYLYRLIATSPEGNSAYVGRFVRIR